LVSQLLNDHTSVTLRVVADAFSEARTGAFVNAETAIIEALECARLKGLNFD
jgi:hypothetical protein